MTEEKKTSLHETSVALCKVYEELVVLQQVSFSLTEEGINKIDSIVKTVNSKYFGFERFPTLEDKTAAYFCLIIKDHPVTDGNKRLATLWLQICCDTWQLKLNPTIPIDVLAVSVENQKNIVLYDLVGLVRSALFG